VLSHDNQNGGGVYVTVNQTDLKGRKAENITGIRALFVDFDTQRAERVNDLLRLDMPPSMIIETSLGKHHAYWLCDGLGLEEFKPLQQRLITHFIDDGADKSIHDLPRIMRLAGFYHLKGEPFLSQVVHVGERYTATQLKDWVDGLPILEQEKAHPKGQANETEQPKQTHQNTAHNRPHHNHHLTFEQVKPLARGRWEEIFSRLGYLMPTDPSTHAPCPACGGVDRFRFDNLYGNGTFICSQGGNGTKGDDGFSFLEHAGQSKTDALHSVIGVLNDMGLISPYDGKKAQQSNAWQQPEPLGKPSNAKAEPYPIDAFPEFAANAIRAISHYVQCPVEMAANCVLGALSFIVQSRVNAPARHNPKGMPTGLFILTEGESGSRKSQASNLAEKYIRDFERASQDKFREEKDNFSSGLAGLKGGDRADYLSHNHEPTDPAQTFTDATLEAVTGRFVDGWIKSALWSTDEAAQFLHGATMKGDTAASALGTFTKLFDSGLCERQRSKSNLNGSGRAYDVSLTFSLMGQHEILVEALNDPVMRGQGFLARFIAAFPDSLAGTRVQDTEFLQSNAYLDPAITHYWDVCKSFYEDELFKEPSLSLEQGRPVMALTKDALKALLGFYNAVEKQQAAGGVLEHLKPFASRSEEIARRVSTIFAFVDGKTAIDGRTALNGCRVVAHSLTEWRRYSEITPNGESDAQKLLKWLLKHTDKDDRKIAYQLVQARCNPAYLKKKEVLEIVLGELEATHNVRIIEVGQSRYIELNPMLFI
jgi:hypothetical protein